MRKIQYNKGSYNINIPMELIKKKGWVEGQGIWVGMNRNGILELLSENEYNKKFNIEVDVK